MKTICLIITPHEKISCISPYPQNNLFTTSLVVVV